MNSHAKFRGVARRGFSVIYEKPPGGGGYPPPPSVRGLTLNINILQILMLLSRKIPIIFLIMFRWDSFMT